VAVFGSINMDLVVRTPRLPAAGETLTGHTFFTAPGGQSVACCIFGGGDIALLRAEGLSRPMTIRSLRQDKQ